ncbi:hypothetical protein [Halocola ammonii]
MKYYISNITIPLITGAAIYLLFRNLPYFSFVDLSSPLLNPQMVPDWIRFQLPDFLWAYSFSFIFLAIWKDQSNQTFWLLAAFSLSISLELAQMSGRLPGTFDWLDLLAYALGFLISIFIDKKIIQHSRTQNPIPS